MDCHPCPDLPVVFFSDLCGDLCIDWSWTPQSSVANNPCQGSGTRLGTGAKKRGNKGNFFCQEPICCLIGNDSGWAATCGTDALCCSVSAFNLFVQYYISAEHTTRAPDLSELFVVCCMLLLIMIPPFYVCASMSGPLRTCLLLCQRPQWGLFFHSAILINELIETPLKSAQ